MLNRIKREKFRKYNIIIQLTIFTFILFCIGEILDVVLGSVFGKDYSKLNFGDSSIGEILFEVLLLAPIVETILIQFTLIDHCFFGSRREQVITYSYCW